MRRKFALVLLACSPFIGSFDLAAKPQCKAYKTCLKTRTTMNAMCLRLVAKKKKSCHSKAQRFFNVCKRASGKNRCNVARKRKYCGCVVAVYKKHGDRIVRWGPHSRCGKIPIVTSTWKGWKTINSEIKKCLLRWMFGKKCDPKKSKQALIRACKADLRKVKRNCDKKAQKGLQSCRKADRTRKATCQRIQRRCR